MKKNRVLTIGIILGILISALSGIVGNLASNTIPGALKPLLRYIWPIFALVTLAGLSNSNNPDIVQLKSDQELGRSPRRNSASVGEHCERQDDP
jgi:hypothetical protein